MLFSIGQFIAHAKGRVCAFSYDQIAFPQPGGILGIDPGIIFPAASEYGI